MFDDFVQHPAGNEHGCSFQTRLRPDGEMRRLRNVPQLESKSYQHLSAAALNERDDP